MQIKHPRKNLFGKNHGKCFSLHYIYSSIFGGLDAGQADEGEKALNICGITSCHVKLHSRKQQKSSLKFDFNELFHIFFRFKPAQEVHNLRRVLFYLLTYLIG